tara:strand:+ start:1368 stop:1670 length:303 start_codon:yes stop_codon:yes gene_type:complete
MSVDNPTWFEYRGGKHRGSIFEDIQAVSLESCKHYGEPKEIWFKVHRYDEWATEVQLEIKVGSVSFQVTVDSEDALNIARRLHEVASAEYLGEMEKTHAE